MEGFRQGDFQTDSNSIVFATSDALAHYVIMMYQVCHRNLFAEELKSALAVHSKNSNYIQTAMNLKGFDFERNVLQKLKGSAGSRINFIRHTGRLVKEGLLAYDDYTIGFLTI